MFEGNAVSTIDSGHYFYIAPLQKYGLAVMSEKDFKVFKNAPIKLGAKNEEGQYAIDFTLYSNILGMITDLIGTTPTWKYDLAQTDGSFTAITISEQDIKNLIEYS